jgi:ABC-type phosphate/phosphonate transport system permease subunit
LRSVDTLIWALIWINVVGLGPFAGALAIMSSDVGAFGKLMSEAIEAADRRPVDGALSARITSWDAAASAGWLLPPPAANSSRACGSAP